MRFENWSRSGQKSTKIPPFGRVDAKGGFTAVRPHAGDVRVSMNCNDHGELGSDKSGMTRIFMHVLILKGGDFKRA